MRRLVRRLRALVAPPPRPVLSDLYVTEPPAPQHALDIFKGEWTSMVPPPLEHLEAGPLPNFKDARVCWAIDQLGGVDGCSVLELGPLEGAHTWLLERQGARSITAIEANRRAWLRCLVMKELAPITRARFLLGDFVEWLRANPDARFEVGLASGVLYHMADPVELLTLLGRSCRGIYLWTVYYDHDGIAARPAVADRFIGAQPNERNGFRHTLYTFDYKGTQFNPGFCGGSTETSAWMTRDDILAALRHMGFADIRVGWEEPDHPNGPAFAVVARR